MDLVTNACCHDCGVIEMAPVNPETLNDLETAIKNLKKETEMARQVRSQTDGFFMVHLDEDGNYWKGHGFTYMIRCSSYYGRVLYGLKMFLKINFLVWTFPFSLPLWVLGRLSEGKARD